MCRRDGFTPERERLARGWKRMAGVDGVGRVRLAGPVVAAAAVFSPRHIRDGLAKPLDEVNDSKRLSEKKRELFFERLQSLEGFEFGIAVVGAEEVDRINILQATHKAMQEAVAALGQAPGYLLVDGRPVPSLGQAQTALVKGDSLSYSIAAASTFCACNPSYPDPSISSGSAPSSNCSTKRPSRFLNVSSKSRIPPKIGFENTRFSMPPAGYSVASRYISSMTKRPCKPATSQRSIGCPRSISYEPVRCPRQPFLNRILNCAVE